MRPAPGSSEASPPRGHTLRTVVITVVAVLAGLTVIGALAETQRPKPSEDETVGPILVEDFESDELAFTTDTDRFVDQSVVNGRYRIEIKDASNPQVARHVFTHSYPGFSFEATVVHPDVGDRALAALGCWTGDSAYLFVMLPNGDVGLLETISEARGQREEISDLMHPEDVRPPGEPNRMRIDCIGDGEGGATVVTGYVNGTPVVSESIPLGYDSFETVGFFLSSSQHGVTFTIDDVRVRPAGLAPPA
jgi:hypothetical protein